MTDIIERLLTRTDYADREEAADEIMRLRAMLREVLEIAKQVPQCPTTT